MSPEEKAAWTANKKREVLLGREARRKNDALKTEEELAPRRLATSNNQSGSQLKQWDATSSSQPFFNIITDWYRLWGREPYAHDRARVLRLIAYTMNILEASLQRIVLLVSAHVKEDFVKKYGDSDFKNGCEKIIGGKKRLVFHIHILLQRYCI